MAEARFEEQVERLANELGNLIKTFKPNNPDHWEALEALVQAHKILRKLSLEKLVQIPFDFKERR